MACRLSIRYEENQRNVVPDMSYQVDKRILKMSWSMVSIAAGRSSRVSAVTLPLDVRSETVSYNLFKYFLNKA